MLTHKVNKDGECKLEIKEYSKITDYFSTSDGLGQCRQSLYYY